MSPRTLYWCSVGWSTAGITSPVRQLQSDWINITQLLIQNTCTLATQMYRQVEDQRSKYVFKVGQSLIRNSNIITDCQCLPH